MAGVFDRVRGRLPLEPTLLFLIAFALLLLSILLAILVSGPKAAEEPPPEEPSESSPAPSQRQEPALLVTAEQIARLTYTDSRLGPLSWELSEEGLQELNQTLIRYNIINSDEICHFLAQATVETGAGRELTEAGDEAYFQKLGYSTGTRGAGYLHLTHEYGQMAFATWMMRSNVPALAGIRYVNPANHGEDEVSDAYYAALQTAANLGLNVSRYSRIVYDPNSTLVTGADYIAEHFAWESAGYYWSITGVGKALSAGSSSSPDAASHLIGGTNWQSRREAYAAFYPVLAETG